MLRRSLALLLIPSFLALAASPAGAAVDPDLLAGMKARSIGPAGTSGRVPVVTAVESNPNIVYVGAAAGGVWKSVDGALTFTPVFDDQPVASIGAIAIFQANPDVVWVGTGEGNPRNSVSVGNGIYRSLDGGKTWSHLGLEKTERIYRIVLHPTNPDVAWVAALGQAWGENPERGVFKTEDGGKTWSRVLYVDEKTGASDLVMDPTNPNKLYASMWQYRRWPWFFKSGGPGSGIYITWDGGRTWRQSTPEDGLPKGDLGRIGIAVSRSHPEVVYATVEAQKSAIIRSDDGGRTWKTVNSRYDANPRPFYFADIRVDPVQPNRLYSLDFNVRVSNDGGKSFSTFISGDLIHGDYHSMWIAPDNPDLIYLSNDGGVAVTRDGGRTAAFVSNLPLAQFYHVAVDMQTPYNIYGGLQDNGSWRGPNTAWQFGGIRNYEWLSVGTGDGFDTRPDPFDPNYLYAEWQGGNLSRFDLRTGEPRDIKPAPPEGGKLRYNWNAGFATDPFDAGTIYSGAQFLFRSTDRGETWTAISPDLTTNNPEWQKQAESGGLTPDASNAENFTTILSIAPSPRERGVIWVGTDDGRLHVTRDAGKTWTSLEGNVPGVPKNTWIPKITPSKFDTASAFVVFDNHRRGDFTPYVFRTDDWGKTWKSLVTKDLRGHALALEQDPVDKDLLFLGTEFGLWVSLDGGARWLPWKHGVPTTSVMDLVVHPRDHDLVIGTHGRALYVLDDVRPLRTLSEKTMAEPLHLYGIADAQQHWRFQEPGGFGLGSGEFRGENRPYGALITFSVNAPGLPLPDTEKERARKAAERASQRKSETEAAKSEAPPKSARELGAGEVPGTKPKPETMAAAGKDTEKEKKDDEKTPKAEIRIADAAGKTIRTLKVPVTQGLNRVNWALRRDGFQQLPQEEEPDEDDQPAGPEVIPGTYTVTVSYGGHEAKETVRVLPDPRAHNTEADWQAKEAAVARAVAVNDALVEAIRRIRKTRSDADAVVAVLAARKKAAGPSATAAAPDAKPDPLSESADKLKDTLTKLERRVWIPYDAPGIQPETDVYSKLNYVGNYLTSSWGAPSPTHMEYLRQLEVAAAAILADVNRVYATDVAAFRKQVDEAKVRLLPEEPPIEIKK